MPRRYYPPQKYGQYYGDPQQPDEDNYDERLGGQRKKKPWYKDWLVWLGIGAAIIFVLIIIGGGLKGIGGSTGGNETNATKLNLEPYEREGINYIVAQRNAGVNDSDIIQRLKLAKYTDEQLSRVMNLSDPVSLYIIAESDKGTPRQQIVDNLLQQGYAPDVIEAKYSLLEEKPSSLSETLKKNWLLLLLIAGVIAYFVLKKPEDEKTPKIYTLEECRIYAEEKLQEKNADYNPTEEYRNRPDLRQYRYVFAEPIYAEFNSHKPWGHQAGRRKYYLIAVGYDRELVDFRMTENDTDVREFLYGKPKGWEPSSQREYMQLRQGSEIPINRQQPQGPYPGGPTYQPVYGRPGYGRRPGSTGGGYRGYEYP